ncbi:putative efflux pump mfs2 [Colletotrichum viniferum]|nr:putative efflux pump mfs2 [Colletotrichum viniferum]
MDPEASHGKDDILLAPAPTDLELAALPGPAPSTGPTHPKDSDPFLVTFAEPHDPANPLDWPAGRKWMVTDVLSATGFNRIMVSTIMAPALTNIAVELDMSSTESAMALSIYLLATAFGPLIIGPISEIYGRQVVLHSSSVWFLTWNVLCGFANTKGTLIAARFLAGFGASAIYALGGGVLGDIWRPEQRGRSLGMYMLIPLLGAAVRPIIGGFIAARTTWRWMFWSTSIFQAAMIFVSFFSFPESYAPLILRRRAARLRRETGEPRYHTASERVDAGRSASSVLARALSRPLRLLLFHPIIQVSAVLSGFNYGIVPCWVGALIYGWTAQYGPHWMVVDVGVVIMMFGLQLGDMPLTAYVIDTYGEHTTSAMAATQFVESLAASLFPLFAPSMYRALGYGWANSLMALAGTMLSVTLPVFLWKYGARLRARAVSTY